MISLAGTRYEGDVALSDDPEYLQNLGIIEVYQTLLNRGHSLTGGEDTTDLNKALLFAANTAEASVRHRDNGVHYAKPRCSRMTSLGSTGCCSGGAAATSSASGALSRDGRSTAR